MIFSNSGTISKFNRMGLLGGSGSGKIRLLPVEPGVRLIQIRMPSNPYIFWRWVNDPDYFETWSEGLDRAFWHTTLVLTLPLSDHLLPLVAHHHIQPDGMVISTVAQLAAPLNTRTVQFFGPRRRAIKTETPRCTYFYVVDHDRVCDSLCHALLPEFTGNPSRESRSERSGICRPCGNEPKLHHELRARWRAA